MDDLIIKRSESVPVQGATKWAENGFIASIYQKELIFLKPKVKSYNIQDTNDQGFSAATEITELFEFPQRISSEFAKSPNLLMDVTALNEEIRIGQTYLEYTSIEIEWSPANYSDSQEPLLAIVTDNLHCFILERSGSKWSMKFDVLQKIIELNGLDIKKILKPEELAQIRINSFAWTNAITFKEFDSRLLPISTKFFTVATESSNYSIYQIAENNQIVEKAAFEFNFNAQEFAVDCKFSKWTTFDNSHFQCFLAVTTNKNRVLLKPILYNIKSEAISTNKNESVIRTENRKPISILEFIALNSLPLSEYTYFCYASTNELEFVKIDRSGKFQICKVITGSYVLFNSLIGFLPSDDILKAKLILSNTHKDLLFVTIDLETMQALENYLVDYTNLEDDKSPFTKYLRGSWDKGPQKITSMAINERGNFAFIGLTPFDKTLAYDLRLTVDKDTKFAIVPLYDFEGSTATDQYNKLLKLSVFEKGMSAKYLTYELIKSFSSEDPQARESSKSLYKSFDPKKVIVDYTPKNVTLKTLPIALQKLFYKTPEIEAIVSAFILSPPSEVDLKNSCIDIIQQLLALTVTQIDPSSLTSSNDIISYYSWAAYLIKEKIAPKKLIGFSRKEPVDLYIEDIDETEHFSKFNDDDFSVDTIVSDEGHVWKRCTLTLTPLFSPDVKFCRESGSKVNCSFKEDDVFTKAIVEALPICVFSGARYETS